MEILKHECGVAMIRLRKSPEYYKNKYGSYCWGLSKLYLMMEKQHNRGQEGAGIGVLKYDARPGSEYVWRERALGAQAIQTIFDSVFNGLNASGVEKMSAAEVRDEVAMIGDLYMGHLRYSTTGRSGMSYVHPFLRRNNWRSRCLLMCGNFNMTNVDKVFSDVVSRGQHPRLMSDTVLLLEQLGDALDKENHRLYREFRGSLEDPELTQAIEARMDMGRVLRSTAPGWDGGFVICGATGSGDMFVLRDRNGIRPAFWYIDDEVVVVASERPVIQTVMGVDIANVHELAPGSALIVNRAGDMRFEDILGEGRNERCSFERIYFSRGSDADIYRERKALGANVADDVVNAIGGIDDVDRTVFSFIPNTAEVAFLGLVEEVNHKLRGMITDDIMRLCDSGELTRERVARLVNREVRVEKSVIKDIKLRTFIAEGDTRKELAAHVYDITYDSVRRREDTLVVIDDSIVRGTTLRQSILKMLSRLKPRKIVVVSSSPQVRYPDYYGIDMSCLGDFIAFQAAMALIRERGMYDVVEATFNACRESLEPGGDGESVNHVKAIYDCFSDKEISAKISELVNPGGVDVEVVYQTLAGLHKAVPHHPGDWYFSGNYPTPGGYRLVNRAFVNYLDGRTERQL